MTTSAGLRPVIDRPLKRDQIEFTPELRAELRATLDAALTEMHIKANDKQKNQLVESLAFLSEWNAVINLTAIREPQAMLIQHILDSVSILHFIPKEATTLLDVGSGGGFPALPIAVLRPDLEVVSVDSVRKKTDYVNKAAEVLGIGNLSAIHSRVQDHPVTYDVVISRAYASLRDFIDRLEKSGHVERRADLTDRRKWRVHLTPLSRDLLPRMFETSAELQEACFQDLSEVELTQLQSSLTRLRARLVGMKIETPDEESGK